MRVGSLKKMTVAPNTKIILTGAAMLIAIVSCSVAVARAITAYKTPDDDKELLTSAHIVRDIRTAMNEQKYVNVPIQAYIIPSVDAHRNVDIVSHDKRVQYVSGFTGSNATIVIQERWALLWTDSRYFTQAEKQLDKETWKLMKSGMPDVETVEEWLVKNLSTNSRVGIDPFLIESKAFHELREYLAAAGHTLVPIQQNLVDLVWGEAQPAYKLDSLEPLDSQFTGDRVPQKLKEVRKAMKNMNADIMIVTALEDIAWLLNLRGTDLEYSPLFFAYIIISTEHDMQLYLMKPERASNSKIQNHFHKEHIDLIINDYTGILSGINTFIRKVGGKVLLSSASEAIQSVIPAERRIVAESPIMNMRTIKNEAEAQGMRETHKRDGAAIVRYLHLLDTELDDQCCTEIQGAETLKSLKSRDSNFRRLSYPTVSAVGAHAAMVQTTPTYAIDSQITRQEIYLIDSGSHHKEGTTDTARTVHFGTPSDAEKDAFTRVLKGFISIATAVFPPHAPFSFFDAMVRRALWDAGLDYDHETGHGVGAYLPVKEYPPLLSINNKPPGICKNMFISIEPSYYEDGKFGIRIGNVLQVVDVPESSNYFNGKGAYKFEVLTMVPIQIGMIDVDLLSKFEIQWLNEYHENVRKNIIPLLNDDSNVIEWLEAQTRPIVKEKPDCELEEPIKPSQF